MASARRVSGGDVSSIVTLNVGGRIFTTYRATLLQYPDSMLAAMMGGSHQTCIVSGSVFIDRDPDLFEFILDFLRSGPNDFELPSEQRTCRSACVLHHHSHGSRVPTHPCVLPTRAAYISHTTSQLKSFPLGVSSGNSDSSRSRRRASLTMPRASRHSRGSTPWAGRPMPMGCTDLCRASCATTHCLMAGRSRSG